MMIASALLGLTAAAGLAAAAPTNVARQDQPSSCTTALKNILLSSDPALACIAPSTLSPLIFPGGAQIAASALAQTMDTWLTDMCAVGSCSAATIQEVATQISAGCGDKFGDLALSTPVGSLVTLLTNDYPIIRQSLCLKNTVKNTFCRTDSFLKKAGDPTTLLSLGSVAAETLLSQVLDGVFAADCDDCMKAEVQAYGQAFPDVVAKIQASNVCNATFFAGINSPPVGVAQVAVNGDFVPSGSTSASGSLPSPSGSPTLPSGSPPSPSSSASPSGGGSSCDAAVQNIISSPDPAFKCIAPDALQRVLAVTTSIPQTIQAVEDWLNSMCAVGTCSDDTIAQVAAQLSAGCGSVFGELVLVTPAADLTTFLKSSYPAIRQSMCLKNTGTNSFCLTNTLKTLGANITQQVDVSSPEFVLSGLIEGIFVPTCDDCTKASFQAYSKAFPDVAGRLQSSDLCPAAFLSGINTPANGVAQVAVNAQFSSTATGSGAAPSSSESGKPKSGGAGTLAAPALGLLFAMSAVFTLL
ncbi:hypothetical protein DFH09DRAFT_1135187 [Mycena vulgaris]|nr:hypothetical protein DFH09DRAFT_1135187 [Mycena vulgaris]